MPPEDLGDTLGDGEIMRWGKTALLTVGTTWTHEGETSQKYEERKENFSEN